MDKLTSVEEIEAGRALATEALSALQAQKDRDLLIRLESLRAEKARRQTQERIRYFRPHPKQQRAFSAGANHRLRWICGGNRSGKTEWLIAEAVAHAKGTRDWLPKDHPDYIVRHPLTGKPIKTPNNGLIVGESFGEQIKKTLLKKLIGTQQEGGLLPTPMIKAVKRNQQGVINEIYLVGGGAIFFKSYEQGAKLFESENYEWYALDEPPPREIYIAISRGSTDSGAPIWCAMTPLSQAWIHDEILSRDDVYRDIFDITDNIGYGLTAEAVAEFEKDLTEDEKEMRLRGRFFHLQGLVYKEFDRNIHLLNRPEKAWPRSDQWQYWMHVDPHIRKRHKAIWVAIRPDGTYLVIGQLQTPHDTNLISYFADQIHEYEKNVLGLRIDDVERLIDPLAVPESVTGDGLSIIDEFANAGLYFRPGSKKRETAIHYTHELLRARPDEGYYPQLYILRDCDQVIYEFEHYQYEEWAGKNVAERKDPNPAPRKKFDDYLEGLHRIILATYNPHELEDDRRGYNVPRKSGAGTGY